MLFYITYHLAITITYFSLPSKTNKQICHLLLKYHLFFTLIYCPLATSPLVPGQVIRVPRLPWQGRDSELQLRKPAGAGVPTHALLVSAAICSARSPWMGQRLSLQPPQKGRKAGPFQGPTSRKQPLCIWTCWQGPIPGKQQLTKQDNALLFQGP